MNNRKVREEREVILAGKLCFFLFFFFLDFSKFMTNKTVIKCRKTKKDVILAGKDGKYRIILIILIFMCHQFMTRINTY